MFRRTRQNGKRAGRTRGGWKRALWIPLKYGIIQSCRSMKGPEAGFPIQGESALPPGGLISRRGKARQAHGSES